MNNETKNSRLLKIGSFSIVSLAIVLAVVILINLAAAALPSRYTKYSVSGLGLYDMTEDTEKLIKGVKDDITIYVVAESNMTDEIVLEYCRRAADLNKNITCKTVDPVLKPAFLAKYTEEALSSQETNVIVENSTNGRSKVIAYNEIYYKQYSEYEAYYYQMMGYAIDNPTYFAIEQCLDTAVDYVTAAKLPTVYYTTGHGETAPDATITKYISDDNIELKELALLTAGSVPEDADAVFIQMASKDFDKTETDALRTYVDNGGNIILVSGYNNDLVAPELENLYGLTAEYGMTFSPVLVFEGSSTGYYQAPYYILPQIETSNYSQMISSNTYIILPFAHEIVLADKAPDGITLNTLFTTSVKGYAKDEVTAEMSVAKAEGDREGKFVIGAEAVNEKNGRIAWISSAEFSDGSTAGSFSNVSYFMAMLTTLSEKGSSITVNAKALQTEALQVSESSANLWGIIIIGIVPVLVLAIGIIVWRRRTKQ